MITDNNYTDDPVSSASEDALGRSPIAAQLASALNRARALKASSVFSLVGGWGSGKSSVINLLTEKLRQGANETPWAVVDFNPWAYSDDEALQLGFYQELLQQLKPYVGRQPVKDAIGKIRTASAGIRGIAPFLSFFNGPVDAGKLTELLADVLDESGSLSRQMKEAAEALERADVPILFILDDVDRLAPAELVMVTKLVRLTGRLPHVHYLLCFDEQTILDVLTRTDLVPDDKPARAQAYLEKIIQLRFDVPPLRRAQTEQLVGDAMTRLEAEQGLPLSTLQQARLSGAINAHLIDRLRTPRSIRRLFTQLPHSLEALGREVDLVDFLIITWLRLEEPALYSWIEWRRDWILNTELEVQRRGTSERPPLSGSAELQGDLDRLRIASEHRDGLMRLLGGIFPVLKADWANQPRPEGSTSRLDGPRVSNPDYFGRYFAFDVPEEDISDSALENALTALTNQALESDALVHLDRVMRRDPELVIRKLTDFIRPSPPQVAWFMNRIDAMSEAETGLATQRAQLTQLVARLLARLDRADRDSFITGTDDSPKALRTLTEVGGYFVGVDREVTDQLGVYIGSLHTATEGVVDAIAKRVSGYAAGHVPASANTTVDDFWGLLRAWSRLDEAATRHWITNRLLGGWDLFDTVGGLLESKLLADGTRAVRPGGSGMVPRYIDTDAKLPQFENLGELQVTGLLTSATGTSARVREAERVIGDFARSKRYTNAS